MKYWYKSTYKRLPNSLRRHVARILCKYVSYTVSASTMAWLLSTPIGRRYAYSNAQPVLKYYEKIGLEHNRDNVARIVSMYELLFPLSYGRFLRCPRHELDRWISVVGYERLRPIIASNKGLLLLANHIGPGHIIDCYLSRQGVKLYSVQSGNFHERYQLTGVNACLPHCISINQDASPAMMQTTTKVRDLLRNGETVLTAVDARAGSSGIKVKTRNGRYRTFRTALPFVASQLNAAVVPVFTTLKSSGHIKIVFESPLPGRSRKQDPSSHAEYIVRRCVELMNSYMKKEPGCMRTGWFSQ